MLAPPKGGFSASAGPVYVFGTAPFHTLLHRRESEHAALTAPHALGNIDAPSIHSVSSTCGFGITLRDGCVDIFSARKNTVITDATDALQLNQATVVRPAEPADEPVTLQLLRTAPHLSRQHVSGIEDAAPLTQRRGEFLDGATE